MVFHLPRSVWLGPNGEPRSSLGRAATYRTVSRHESKVGLVEAGSLQSCGCPVQEWRDGVGCLAYVVWCAGGVGVALEAEDDDGEVAQDG